MNERDREFIKALGEAWSFIRSDGSFTRRQLKEWVNSLDENLARETLISLITTAWTDYGGRMEGLPGEEEA
ncbi:hypothetical protein [Paenibacillus amylolyticus]|uniref:hypothetical protein n=1 Tax=Paenibacillus amylolyticus TaxID=1451 RepID=UPI00096C378B|nr:hypothetical protein [Paenibacillus amylolyticus]OMF47733.1 hypothetical protein BK136_02240 [Paenibacillus amylolyticus]